MRERPINRLGLARADQGPRPTRGERALAAWKQDLLDVITYLLES